MSLFCTRGLVWFMSFLSSTMILIKIFAIIAHNFRIKKKYNEEMIKSLKTYIIDS